MIVTVQEVWCFIVCINLEDQSCLVDAGTLINHTFKCSLIKIIINSSTISAKMTSNEYSLSSCNLQVVNSFYSWYCTAAIASRKDPLDADLLDMTIYDCRGGRAQHKT